MEKLICSDDNLRYGDRMLAQAWMSLKDAGGNQKKNVAEQKDWLQNVRDRCADAQCLQTAVGERTTILNKQREDFMAATKEQIGYKKQAIYSDQSLWPKDATRTIAIYATQKSVEDAAGSGAQADEDFDLDIYVLDSATHKILQHAVDSVSSDAISFEGFGIDNTDYSSQIGAQAFGISLSHTHRGCAGYDSSSIKLYAVNGRKLKLILPQIAMESSHGMCGSDCENGTTRRELGFANKTGIRYPDLIIREKKSEEESDPAGAKDSCKTVVSSKQYTLRFDGTQYVVPDELGY
jgi:uncharacterized protein